MLLPVVKASGNTMKPKFWLLYKHTSIASLDTVAASDAKAVSAACSVRPRLIWAYTTL